MRHTFSVNGVIFMVFGKLLFKRFVFQACHVKITFLLRCLLKNVSERVTFTPRHRGLEPWLLLAASLIDGSGLRMTHSLRQPRWLCASGIGRSFQFSNHLVAQMLSWLTFLGKGSFSTSFFFLSSAGNVVFHKLFCGLLAQEPVCFSLFSLSGRFTVWSTERRVISSNPCTVPLLLETWFGVETNGIHEHHFGSVFEYLAHKWDKNI